MKLTKQKKVVLIVLYIFASLVLAFFIQYRSAAEKSISISIPEKIKLETDKKSYQKGEIVELNLRNNSPIKIYTKSGFTIEKLENDKWTKISRAECGCGPVACLRTDLTIKPLDRLNLEWNQQESWCDVQPPDTGSNVLSMDRFEKLSRQVDSGNYRAYIYIRKNISGEDTTKITSKTFDIE